MVSKDVVVRVSVVGSIALVLAAGFAVPVRWAITGGLWQSGGADPSLAGRSVPAAEGPSPADEGAVDTGARVNLAGDEVSPAVATYGVDREGNLYEVHSPDTEEPRLESALDLRRDRGRKAVRVDRFLAQAGAPVLASCSSPAS